MDPLDFLKQKIGQGLSDVKQWGSDAGNDVTDAIHSVFNSPQTQQTQQTVKVQPAQTNQTVSVGQPQNMAKLQTQGQTNQNNPLVTNLTQPKPAPMTNINQPKLAKLSTTPAPKLQTTAQGGGYLTPTTLAKPIEAVGKKVATNLSGMVKSSPLVQGIKIGAGELTGNQQAVTHAKQGLGATVANFKNLSPTVKKGKLTVSPATAGLYMNAAMGSEGGAAEEGGVRDMNAEGAAQDVLRNNGKMNDAVKAYQQVHPTDNADAQFQVKRMARESNLSVMNHTSNPEDGQHDLPIGKPGDYDQATINKSRVNDTLDNLNKNAQSSLTKLSDNDRTNFQDYLEGTKPLTEAEDSGAVQTAIDASTKLTDTANAFDRSVFGNTPHINNYFPEYIDRTDPTIQAQDALQTEQDLEEEYGPEGWQKLTPAERQALINERMSTAEKQPISEGANYGGFRNMRREFTTRQDVLKAGFKPLYDDPRDSLNRYTSGAKFVIGNQAFTKAAEESDVENATGVNPQNTIDLGGGKSVRLSDEGYKALKNEDINVGKGGIVSKANRAIKQSLISLGVPHAVIIPQRALGAWFALHTPALNSLADGATDLTKINPDTPALDNVEFGNQIDSPLHSSKINAGVSDVSKGAKLNPLTIPKRVVYNWLLPNIHDSLLTAAKNYMDDRGIGYDSPEARNIGHQINDVMGYSKNSNGLFEQSTFAPSLIKSTANMYAKALTPSGTVARGGVIGQQLFNEGMGFLSKAISNKISQAQGKPQNKSKDDFLSTLVKEAYDPTLYTPYRNAKGEQVDLNLPGQYQADVARIPFNINRGNNGQLKVGLNNPLQIASNIAQTGKDIASPVLSAGLSAATNQAFNGSQIRNPYAPIGTQAAQTGINTISNALPINLQGLINQNLASKLPPTLRGAVELNQNAGPMSLRVGGNTLGLNPKADVTTGSGPAITTYYKGQTQGQDYIAAHSNSPATQTANMDAFNQYSARTKNNAGQTILLGPQASKANAALLASNPTVLAGVQIAEKANGKGNYNPIWDLPLNKLKVYQTYESLDDGDPNRTVMEQKNPWLINTFNQENTYFNNLSYTSTAVKGPGYVAYPTISPAQSDLMTQVSTLSANQNRTPAQETQLQTLENNTSLQAAYTMLDQYTNARRGSEGLAPIPYPSQNLTPQQSALLAQEEALPKGSKSAFITANQGQWNQISQVLAQDTIYNVEKQGGVIQQGGTEPDFLKNTYNAGQYDISAPVGGGTDASGYALNPTLAYAQAKAANQQDPLVPLPPRLKRVKKASAKKPRMAKFKHIRQTRSLPVKTTGGLQKVAVLKPTQVAKVGVR